MIKSLVIWLIKRYLKGYHLARNPVRIKQKDTHDTETRVYLTGLPSAPE